MTDTPFIKFYPSDFLGGTSGLSPAERGVYITLLCLMYESDGPIARDDARLARRCGAPKAAFIRILDALIDVGKVTQDGDMLSNRRAEKALMDRTNRTQNAAHAAKERWSAPAKKNEQNQGQEDAGAMPEQCVADAKPEARSQKEEKNPLTPFELLSAVASPDVAKDFIDHRTGMKRPLTKLAAKKMADKLRKHPDPDAVLNYTIENGWQGIFPERVEGMSKSGVNHGAFGKGKMIR